MLLFRLIKRNILVYIRDKASIFFSLLSMLIIIGLMVIFLGKMNADGIIDIINQYGNSRDTLTDRNNAEELITLWTLSGIVVVNSITITLAMVGIMVEDEAQKRLASFYVSPVNRGIFVIGYVVAAIIMGIIMCTLTVFIGLFYIWYAYGIILTTQIIQVFFYIILNVFFSASMVFFIVNFVHSVSAFSGLSTIIGTLVGFMAAIYLPMGMLSEKVQSVLKFFPLLHGCSLMRSIFTSEIAATTFQGLPEDVLDGYKNYMGMTISVHDTILDDKIKILIMVISGIIFLCLSAFLQKKRNIMAR